MAKIRELLTKVILIGHEAALCGEARKGESGEHHAERHQAAQQQAREEAELGPGVAGGPGRLTRASGSL